MATYLLTWNPNRWVWENLQECIEKVNEFGFSETSWSCGVTKRIISGDRVFLMKLGGEPKGIMASGWVTREVYQDLHWDESFHSQGIPIS